VLQQGKSVFLNAKAMFQFYTKQMARASCPAHIQFDIKTPGRMPAPLSFLRLMN